MKEQLNQHEAGLLYVFEVAATVGIAVLLAVASTFFY